MSTAATVTTPQAMIANVDYSVKLPAFEGPLDLLLFLIRKQEIDIYDIPIKRITSQYLDILGAMEEIKPDVAGEFFVMAATLMEIKSRMLLPRHQQNEAPDTEDEFDPRWELVHQLLEYQKFKKAAGDLHLLAEETAAMIPRQVEMPRRDTAEQRPLKPSDKLDLWYAFNQVLKRLSEKLVLGEIAAEQVSVSDRMEFLLERSRRETSFLFSSLFRGESVSIRTLVATFLALLELVRLKHLQVIQNENFSDIHCLAKNENELENPSGSTTLES